MRAPKRWPNLSRRRLLSAQHVSLYSLACDTLPFILDAGRSEIRCARKTYAVERNLRRGVSVRLKCELRVLRSSSRIRACTFQLIRAESVGCVTWPNSHVVARDFRRWC